MIDAPLERASQIAPPTPTQGRRVRVQRMHLAGIAVFVLAAAVFAIRVRHYFPYLEDDSLISVQYASRLLHGHGLTWTDGRPVEGYTNLLWVLALAGLGALGFDLIVAARMLGIVGMLVGLGAVVWWFRPTRVGSALPALAAGLSFALAGPIAVWAIGGLEQPLLVGLVAIGAVRMLAWLDSGARAIRPLLLTGLCFGLAALARPDAALFAAVAGLTVVLVGRSSRRAWAQAGALAAFPLALLAAQMAFRVAYYGDIVPNTAYAKVVLSSARLVTGYTYVGDGLWPMAGLVVPALAAVVVSRRVRALRRRVRYLGASFLLYTGYVVFIGGDIFPGRRHLAVGVVFLALMAGEFWVWMVARPGRAHRTTAWALAGLSVVTVGFGAQQWDPEVQRARTERWVYACRQAAGVLQRAYAPVQPRTAVTAAGCMPYFSGLPSLDLLGLNDWHIARHRPDALGTGYLGHELGDPRYVYARKPDIVIPCTPFGSRRGCFYGDSSLVALREFQADYRHVPIRIPTGAGQGFYSLVWLRVASPKVGVATAPSSIAIPGALFGTVGAEPPPGCDAFFGCFGADVVPVVADGPGQLAAQFGDTRSSTLTGIALPAGRWRVEADASSDITVDVQGTGVTREGDVVTVAAPATATVTVTAARPDTRVRGVALTAVR